MLVSQRWWAHSRFPCFYFAYTWDFLPSLPPSFPLR
jgi:hypothetical protein